MIDFDRVVYWFYGLLACILVVKSFFSKDDARKTIMLYAIYCELCSVAERIVLIGREMNLF